MGFWSNLWDRTTGGITANTNPETSVSPTFNPGDPDGLDLTGLFAPVETRSLPALRPTPWDGWPADWSTQWDFGSRFNELIDVAWMCLDINARVLASMPVYRTVASEVVGPMSWMTNPDDAIYASWHEFAKQVFWDYLLGETFILPMTFYSNGYPATFRVVPPWLIEVNVEQGTRTYRFAGGGRDLTGEILHIRYKSTTDTARGVGPLESAGGRILTAGILAKYVRDTAGVGGIALQTLETEQDLSPEDAQDLLNSWIETRAMNTPAPPVLDNNVKLVDHKAVSPKDMAMLELAQFTESRIALLLGVPPFMAGLPVTGGSGDSMTYQNVSQLFDYHDRLSLRTYAAAVMGALSNWSLPRGQAAELNRDEYTRPSFETRADAWVKLAGAGLVTADQFQAAERLTTPFAAGELTGVEQTGEVPVGS